MAKQRKGMGKGQGQGFKNIIPGQDAKTHSNSAKGIKQPQRLNVEGVVRKAEQFKPVEEVVDPKAPKDTSDIEKIGAETKTQAVVKRAEEAGAKALKFAREKLEEQRKKKAEEKIKALKEIDHPVISKLEKQKSRVAEIKEQIVVNEEEENPEREEKLFSELASEENQLRQLQEEATGLQLQELSDAELKTLAIRFQPSRARGFIADFIDIGTGNPYETELVRRIKTKQEIDRKLTDARKEAKQTTTGDPIGGFFGDFFG